MGSKYTRQQVIDERKCGLKFLDRAVAKVGMQAILDETVRIAKEFPDTWGRGWRNVDWAFGNAWRKVTDYDGQASENLDEALTPEQLQWLADQLGHDINAYTPCWDRRPPGKEVKKQPPKPEGTLTTDAIRERLVQLFKEQLADPSTTLHRRLDWDNNVQHYLKHLSKKSFYRESKKRNADRTWLREVGYLDGSPFYMLHVVTDEHDTQILRINAMKADEGWAAIGKRNVTLDYVLWEPS